MAAPQSELCSSPAGAKSIATHESRNASSASSFSVTESICSLVLPPSKTARKLTLYSPCLAVRSICTLPSRRATIVQPFAHVGLQRLYTSGGRGFPRHRPGQRCLLCNGAAAHHEQCDQPSHHFAHVHSPPCRMNPDRIPTFIQRSENGFSFLGCRPKKTVSAPFNRRMPAARPPVPQ